VTTPVCCSQRVMSHCDRVEGPHGKPPFSSDGTAQDSLSHAHTHLNLVAGVVQRSGEAVRRAAGMRRVSFARLTTLVWIKRRFRRDTSACRPSFTESTAQVPARARLTTRLREAIGRAVRTRNVAGVAAEHRVSWWTAWKATVIEAAKALARPFVVAARTPGVGRDDCPASATLRHQSGRPVLGTAVGSARGPLQDRGC
jgi:hypothetical protein